MVVPPAPSSSCAVVEVALAAALGRAIEFHRILPKPYRVNRFLHEAASMGAIAKCLEGQNVS